MNPSFTETQKFNKWWHYAIVGSPVIIMSVIFLLAWLNVLPSKVNENNSNHLLSLIPGIIITIVIFIWFVFMELKTTIDETGIRAHFKGIPFCNKIFTWDEIQSIKVIEYSPMMDYGGWGVRMSFNGWCYNVSGKIGIKFTRSNGKPFLIGTQQKEEAEKIITHYLK